MKGVVNLAKVNLTNLDVKIEGDKLILTVDLTQRHGQSKSGKNTIIASSRGNVAVPGREDIIMGVNFYEKAAQ